MLVGSDQELDKLVRNEIKKIQLPKGWKVDFSPSKTPGRGDFCISGRWNNIKFKYEREFDDEKYLVLKKEGNEIYINADDGGIYSISVNDCSYVNPSNIHCGQEKEPWQEKTSHEIERDEAVEFAGKVVKGFNQYLAKIAKPLADLISAYYTGRLLHPEVRDVPHSNKHVFDKFDLSS